MYGIYDQWGGVSNTLIHIVGKHLLIHMFISKKIMRQFLLIPILLLALQIKGQVPKSGTYTYSIAFAEWNGKSNGATCKVVIKGDSITVYNNGTGNLTGKKGEILDHGIIMKHKKTGKYIIAHDKSDAETPEANGCEGPTVIDFNKKQFWSC